MAQVQDPTIIDHLQNARSPSDTSTALRQLKNEVIGHEIKKQEWVYLGILPLLVAKASPTRNWTDEEPSYDPPDEDVPRCPSPEELVRLQAVQLLASFARGGASFLPPLHAAGALGAAFANLCPLSNHPDIVSEALRLLLSLADAADSAPYMSSPSQIDAAGLAERILAPEHLESFAHILTPQQRSRTTEQHVRDVVLILKRLCGQERHRFAIAVSDVLDALATNLASIAVNLGYVVPGAQSWGETNSLNSCIPDPAPSDAHLGVLLEAIAAIIKDSRYAAYKFLHCPAILAVFPNLEFDPGQDVRASFKALQVTGLGDSQTQHLGAMDYLLPSVAMPRAKGWQPASLFPPLAVGPGLSRDVHNEKSPSTKARLLWSRLEGSASDVDAEETESPVVPWLIHLVRVRKGRDKLSAVSLLTALCNAKFVGQLREPTIGALVVPPLVRIIAEARSKISFTKTSSFDSQVSRHWEMLELASSLLGLLIASSEVMQKASMDADAVTILAALLKSTYEPLPEISSLRPWSSSPKEQPLSTLPHSCRLGPEPPFPLLAFRIKVRASVLAAICSLCSLREEYKTAFVDHDTLPYIVECLFHVPGKPVVQKIRVDPTQPIQYVQDAPALSPYCVNPSSVVILACNTLRMLSRSVGILRTALLDNGIAQPLLQLMEHREIDVQIAATGAICNLVLEMSPMREVLVEGGIIDPLCSHAHSLDARLRLNALWGLKHLVQALGKDLKVRIFERLESGWLVQLICDDTEDDAVFTKTEKHASDELDQDIEMNQPEDSGKFHSKTCAATTGAASSSRGNRLFRYIETRLATLRDLETNPVEKARADDLAIQKEGLDFIRNLIDGGQNSGGTTADASDAASVIDYLLEEIGSDRLFSILSSKLQPKVMHGFYGRRSVGAALSEPPQAWLRYPQPEIVEAAVYVLVHIAASVPKHRQLVISQTELLKLLHTQLSSSKDSRVRLAICHLIHNLTCQEEMIEAQMARQRVLELKKLGFHSRLESLEAEDGNLDVRERAKAALSQMKASQQY